MSEHDRFVRKNQMMADTYTSERTKKGLDKKYEDRKDTPREKTCYNCKKKNRCSEFREKTRGVGGSVSIGNDTIFLCDNYIPVPEKKKDQNISKKEVNSMLKAAKKGRL